MRKLLILGIAGVLAVIAGVLLNRWQVREEPDVPVIEDMDTRADPVAIIDPAQRDARLPLEGRASRTVSVDVVRINRNGELVVAGLARDGVTVGLLSNGREIGRAGVDRRGGWVIMPEAPLPAGLQQVEFTIRLPRAAAAVSAGQSLILTIPGSPPPTGELPVLALAAPAAGGVGRLLVGPTPADGVARGEPAGVRIDLVDLAEDGRFAAAGQAPAGSWLRLYVDNAQVEQMVADGSGHWRCAPLARLKAQGVSLRLDQVNELGRVQARAELILPAAGPLAVGELPRLEMAGAGLWRLVRLGGSLGTLVSYVAADLPERQGDPDEMYPSQNFAPPQLEH